MSDVEQALPGMQRLLTIMRQLRDPQSGCPWDLKQDSRSLARHLLEEAYELVAALESGDSTAVRDELGDVLFQVVFHAQLATENRDYDFDAVAAGIANKLERRHPHVFASAVAEVGQWEQIKATERTVRGATSTLDDLPLALPALQRATKLGKRAATVGFDWPDASGARDKIMEELEEITQAQAGHGSSTMEDEMGDLLLAVTSYARHLKVDPETALRRANQRFEARFRLMEQLAAKRQLNLAALSPAALDQLWMQAKNSVQS
jgi:nucleoside triphosphate diphosphatase